MILYFSGTGNSQWVAEQLADFLHDCLYEISDVLKECRSFYLKRDESLGIVFPVYSWGPPPIVLDLIHSLRLSHNPEWIYFVCTCGDDAGKTAAIIRRAIAEKGWRCQAGYSVIMPNTYICLPGFDVDSPAIITRKLADAEKRLVLLKGWIRDRIGKFDCHEGRMPWLKTYIIRPFFNRYMISACKFHASEDCISCGICQIKCPLQNISVQDKPIWRNHCTMCLACYHHCPRHAIAYGSWTKGKGQYLFPNSENNTEPAEKN